MEVEIHEDQKFVKALLQTSLAISVALMLTGIVLHFVVDAEGMLKALHLEDLMSGQLTGVHFLLGWGIMVLAMTPALRVIALAVLWAKAKDWVYASVAVTVILTLILAIAVGEG